MKSKRTSFATAAVIISMLPVIASAQTSNNTTTTTNLSLSASATRGNDPSTIRNTPSSAIAMATAYCQNVAGIGGSGPGFSLQALFGGHDIDCKRLNFAIFLANTGRTDEALAVLINNREVAEAFRTADRWRQERAAQLQSTTITAGPPDPLPSRKDCAALRILSRQWTQAQRLQYNRGCR